MKHLLNNLSNEEKNRIREQHEGGIKIDNSKFKKLQTKFLKKCPTNTKHDLLFGCIAVHSIILVVIKI